MNDGLTEIPTGALNEIKMQYPNATIELDSDVTEDTITRKLHYKEVSPTLETSPVMDPLTFETNDVTGYPTKCYMVRLDVVNEDTCIVRRVLFSGSVLSPTKGD